MSVTVAGTQITYNDSTVQTTAPYFLRTRTFTSSMTYTKPADVRALYFLVYGATGGRTTVANGGGVGGPGYGELYVASPSSSYTITIGAGGSTSGTAGGTTSVGAISVTGSNGVTGTSGSTGGASTGGGFNVTGGTGGSTRGGAGGAASRAGNGGNGGNGTTTAGGGGGGTGGNNGTAASGSTPGNGGSAATTTSASALAVPIGNLTIGYSSGFGGVGNTCCAGALGGRGATSTVTFDGTNPGIPSSLGTSIRADGGPGAVAGNSGIVQVIEICTLV